MLTLAVLGLLLPPGYTPTLAASHPVASHQSPDPEPQTRAPNNHTGFAQVLEEKDGATGDVTKTYTLGHDVLTQRRAPTIPTEPYTSPATGPQLAQAKRPAISD